MSGWGKTPEFSATDVTLSAFWPVLNLGEFQSEYNLPAGLADIAIESQLKLAAIKAIKKLEEKKQEWIAEGITALADVSLGYELDESVAVIYFKRAVYCYAKAKLFAFFASSLNKAAAADAAKEWDGNENYWLRESITALNELTGATTVSCELL